MSTQYAIERMLFWMELRHCFSPRRLPVIVVMLFIGIFLVVQESELPPLVIVVIAVVAILEPQFNNILFRAPRELEALSMFPLSWKRVVLVKNCATIAAAGIVTVLAASILVYFSPRMIGMKDAGQALLYAGTLLFPLLHIGNNESIRTPRRISGWQPEDLVQALGMFLFVAVLSMPCMVFTAVFHLPVLAALYAILTAWYWLQRSIRNTAHEIESKKTHLCSTQ